MSTFTRRTIAIAAATLALGAVTAGTASAAPAPGYDCLIGNVTLGVFTGQYCAPRGGAPAAGPVSGSFTATTLLVARARIQCDPLLDAGLPLTSGVATQSNTGSVQIIGTNCHTY
ncbi:hypothetical protein [Actinosynnema sp. NPDC020468]|uniref:hypothetical protein n=1 Tax=Actinosynnema sp. NPDC020468 TaxID=3154488 RepID=UPI00340D918C